MRLSCSVMRDDSLMQLLRENNQNPVSSSQLQAGFDSKVNSTHGSGICFAQALDESLAVNGAQLVKTNAGDNLQTRTGRRLDDSFVRIRRRIHP